MEKLRQTYKNWHGFLPHLPRLARFTLGTKIDALFTDSLEVMLLASYSSKEQKLLVLQKASTKLDTLKFFLQTAWELKILDNKKYSLLAEPLVEIGRMLGGWMNKIKKETPPKGGE
ncbi:MAG: four helix bundle protein [Candidatus Doudnabacteria bacterium]|nr:four helix bundle protein [Candidatus Doudnabacteria bacterium]